MNIFYLDSNPKTCAEYHCDKHVVKMILEYAQLLSTAHRVLDGALTVGISKTGRKAKRYVLPDARESILYTATHINHPSAVWVRKSRENYAWLFHLLECLCNEYTHRYGKTHKVQRSGLLDKLWFVPSKIPEHPKFTEPTPAMPDQYKVQNDSIESYRNYYRGAKASISGWKNRTIPEWFSQ